MKEIVRVNLENEMDLILAHKRAMKLSELTGFSLIQQTSIATAVSEIARCAIDHGRNACLILGVDIASGKKMYRAVISDVTDFTSRCVEPVSYAKRLVDNVEVTKNPGEYQIVLKHQLAFGGTISDAKISSFISYFKTEPPLSPYDELRRKNLLLQDMAEKIRESENEYRLLTDTLPVMMFSVNNRGMITYSNKWFQNFLHTVPKEFSSAAWQSVIHASDFNSFARELDQAMVRQTSFSGQYRIREKSTGKYIWHIVSVIPLRNEKEMVIRWIGFLVDINAQKVVEQTLKDNRELKEIQQQLFQHQEELQQKVVELNRSNYELEQFAHLASHDLQEPLRKLFFYSDVLKKKYADKVDEAGAGMLNNMVRAAGRMKELITDLLTYSQIQKQKMNFEWVDLNEVMTEVVRDLEVVIREKQATLDIPALPKVYGNSVRLRQLFTNLISNALKYSRADNAPQISVMVETDERSVVIRVKDNGIGFEEQYKERIFGLFERLHNRDKYPGTGIGLSICKRITELHNGSISAWSKPNEYSVFEVKLPKTPVLQE
jgi:PAS domain S-box-containing protein